MAISDKPAIMSSKEMSEEHKELVQKLRDRMSDIEHPEKYNDNFVIKWLIARNYNVDKAEVMLRKHVHFVMTNELDKIDAKYTPPKAVDYFYTAMLGYDKEGSVVRILDVGTTDLKTLVFATTRMDSIKNAAFILRGDVERQKRERANDIMCEKQVFIMDLKGLVWKDVMNREVIERTFMLLKTYEANYPENLKTVFVINAPSFFNVIYNWMKGILPESILSKVNVLTPDNCTEVITKLIDPSIIPASIGGTRTDPDGDPTCKSLYPIPPGTPFPEHLMAHNQFGILNNDAASKRVTIESKSSLSLKFPVTEPKSIIHWDFQTVSYDIRMGLMFKKSEISDTEEIIKVHKVDCHRIPESGRYVCQKAGIYEIVFDNTYSWLTKKDIVYKINILVPEESN